MSDFLETIVYGGAALLMAFLGVAFYAALIGLFCGVIWAVVRAAFLWVAGG